MGPDAADFGRVDLVLATIAHELSKKSNLTLVDISDGLINKHLIQNDESGNREVLHQLIFKFLGWLSRWQKSLLVLATLILTSL